MGNVTRTAVLLMIGSFVVSSQHVSYCSIPFTGCSCDSQRVVCINLGELSSIPSKFVSIFPKNYSTGIFDIHGWTKIRNVQAGVFNGTRIKQLYLDNLGIRSIDPMAFHGLPNVSEIHLSGNSIDSIQQGTFLNVSLNDLNVSSNEIGFLATGVFSGYIYKLDLSNNRIYNIPDHTFITLSPSIYYLNISSNLLTSISEYTFDGLGGLYSLHLDRNSITYIHPNAFSNMRNLRYLWMNENRITDVLFVAQLWYFDVSGNRLQSIWWPNVTANVSIQVELRADRNALSLASLQTFVGHITNLSLRGNRLAHIPDGYFNQSQYEITQVLDISRNNITALTRRTFAGLGNLHQLQASHNNIHDLPLGSLDYFTSLTTLDLSDNSLTRLVAGLFNRCLNLSSINLASNGLSSIPLRVFSNLVRLRSINLSFNQLKTLLNQTFTNLPELSFIDLSNNQITLIDSAVFDRSQIQPLGVFTGLNLSGNRLTTTPFYSSLVILACGSKLHLQENSITELDAMTIEFQCISSEGNSVDMSGNEISSIKPLAFNSTKKISILNLSYNLLTRLTRYDLIGLLNLVNLDLSNNQLNSIEPGSFLSVPHLSVLNLSYNSLYSNIVTSFDGLGGSLTLFTITGNNLGDEFFTGSVMNNLAQLNDLEAGDNGITMIDGENSTWLLWLTSLSLPGNVISRLPGFSNSLLLNLDLNNNNISDDFVTYDLPLIVNLQSLLLANNQITTVDSSLPSTLLAVDLSNNQLTSDSLIETFSTTPNLAVLMLDGNLLENLSGLGIESINDSLTQLSIKDNFLDDDSWDVISQLVRLVELNLDNNALSMIPDSVFLPMYNLRTLSISGNNIMDLYSLTFDGLESSCTRLDLSHNCIAIVDPATFQRLSKLEFLDLSSNDIISIVLPPTLDSLSVLRLDNNQLDTFPDGPVQFRSIRMFDMSGNAITTLPDLEIYNIADADGFVELVDFANNSLLGMTAFGLCPIGSYLEMNFQGNYLSFHPSSSSPPSSASPLSSSSSSTTSQSCIARVVQIVELNLAGNGLNDDDWLGLSIFWTFVSRLNLNNNLLTRLAGVPTTASSSVVDLSVANNMISTIEDDFPPTINDSIETIDLRGNLLKGLSQSAFISITGSGSSLSALKLADNPWRCDCSLAWLRDGSLSQIIDKAKCLTPMATAGQFIVCFDVPASCSRSATPSNGIGLCSASNTLNASTVSSVSPLFGPVAGGTPVTLTGKWLNYSEPLVLLYPADDAHYDVITMISPVASELTFDTLVALTPAVDSNLPPQAITHLTVNVIFSDAPTVFTPIFFDYRPDPLVTGVSPTNHLVSGGTQVTLIGINMDSASVPVIQVVTVVQRYNSSTDPESPEERMVVQNTNTKRCGNLTHTAIICPMPPVTLPPDFINYLNTTSSEGDTPIVVSGNGTPLIIGPNGRDTASVSVGVIFDGEQSYDNFTSSLPRVQIKFFPLPMIGYNGIIDFNPGRQTFIDIRGKNMVTGAQLIDYTVTIGSVRCVGKALTDNVLTCAPPSLEPLVNGNTNNICSGQMLNSVMVRVGYSNSILCACIRYVSDSSNVALIVGLAVGLGVPFIILCVALIACLIHRKSLFAVKTTQGMYRTSVRHVDELRPTQSTNNERNFYRTSVHQDADDVANAQTIRNTFPAYSKNLPQIAEFDSSDVNNSTTGHENYEMETAQGSNASYLPSEMYRNFVRLDNPEYTLPSDY